MIDGYNFLKQILPTRHISENERQQCIDKLKIYARKKNHTIIIVFDGGPFSWATKEKHGSVYSVYSGTVQSADDYIKQYIKHHPISLLVSNDRELIDQTKHHAIERVSVAIFYRHMLHALTQGTLHQKKDSIIHAMNTEHNDDLDFYMKEAATMVKVKKEDYEENVISIKGNKRSKKDRKKDQILKKL